jgi:hypothetical protein
MTSLAFRDQAKDNDAAAGGLTDRPSAVFGQWAVVHAGAFL